MTIPKEELKTGQENSWAEGIARYTRTYSLKTKDGVYAWFYDDDGTERFPGVTFSTSKEATKYWDKLYGRTYVRFEPRKGT